VTPAQVILNEANAIRVVRRWRAPGKPYRARHLQRAVCVVRRAYPHGRMPRPLIDALTSLGHYANDPRSPRRPR
jgi:adenine-specific DNA glycosylase